MHGWHSPFIYSRVIADDWPWWRPAQAVSTRLIGLQQQIIRDLWMRGKDE